MSSSKSYKSSTPSPSLSLITSSHPRKGSRGVYPTSGISSPVEGAIVPPFGPKHSVKLSTPPPSQSAVAIFELGNCEI